MRLTPLLVVACLLICAPAGAVSAPRPGAKAGLKPAPAVTAHSASAAPLSSVSPAAEASAALPELEGVAPAHTPGKEAPRALETETAEAAAGFDGAPAPQASAAVLSAPEQAWAANAALAASAQRSLDSAYFIYAADDAGLADLSRLRAAAQRGVPVRLLVDAWGSRIPRYVLRHVIEEGVSVRLFHPLHLEHLAWIFQRLHDKLMIADGARMIVGDRNKGNPYFGIVEGEIGGEAYRGAGWTLFIRNLLDSRRKEPFRNRDLFVEGAPAAQAKTYFDALWESEHVAAPRGLDRVSSYDVERGRRLLDRAAALGPDRAAPVPELRPVREARFVHDSVGPGERRLETHGEVLALIAGARRTLDVENPYVVLPDDVRRALAAAIARGVRVRLVTNSHGSANIRLAQIGYEADRAALIAMGVELWEYQGPGTFHAKTIVADGEVSYVGSHNLDPRSERFNFENGVIIRDAALAAGLLADVESDLAACRLVGKERRWLVKPSRPSLLWRALAAMLRSQV